MDIVSLKNSVNNKKTKKQEDEKEINFLEKIKEQEQVFEKMIFYLNKRKKKLNILHVSLS